MGSVGEYKTKELECLRKGAELSAKRQQEFTTARQEYLVIGTKGRNSLMYFLLAGLGERVWHGPPTAGADRIRRDKALIQQCIEAVEGKEEFGPDSCGLERITVGSALLGLVGTSCSGERVEADFHLNCFRCPGESKQGQLWHEYFGVPAFEIEFPPGMTQAGYLVSQMHDAIEWMEKTTGREYDDERLIEGLKNEWESKRLWARICQQLKAKPAPIDIGTLFTFDRVIRIGGRHTKEVRDFLQMALDEIRDRVASGISARGYEKCRLGWEGTHPLWSRFVFDYPRRYGAVFLGHNKLFHQHGAWEVAEDGALNVAPSIDELGIELRNRGQALEAAAVLFCKYNPHVTTSIRIWDARRELVRLQEDWKIDAFVVNEDRTCFGFTLGSREKILALQKKGIPVLRLSIPARDPRKVNDQDIKEMLDTFLTQRLKLEDTGVKVGG